MLAELMKHHKLSLSQVESITGLDRSTLSLIRAKKYNGNRELELQAVEKLKEAGYEMPAFVRLAVKPDVFVTTENVIKFQSLCDELKSTDLTSSFGIVSGRAGRGKTKTAIWYTVQNPQDAVYVLYIDGMSIPQLAREICFEVTGLRPRSFYDCLIEIEKTTRLKRKLILIDEADKMPKKYIEMLRGFNERCLCPVALIGEETITSKLDEERRLKSRVRRVVQFEPMSVSDVVTFYQMAVGIDIDPSVAMLLWERAKGDFRVVVRDAYSVVRVLNTNETTELTAEMVAGL